mmetsp:Transcript_2387/g.2774  ORF Transcript_2387/g.2774 Transcript_2387/m.2774 type:complete len:96 (-) Transcript_2387:310-597(-)
MRKKPVIIEPQLNNNIVFIQGKGPPSNVTSYFMTIKSLQSTAGNRIYTLECNDDDNRFAIIVHFHSDNDVGLTLSLHIRKFGGAIKQLLQVNQLC